MPVIDDIMWLLKDGKWHDLEEITKKLAVPKITAELAVSFLAEYDFIQLNIDTRRVKLHPSILGFIEETQHV